MNDPLSRRRFNKFLLSAGAACALPSTLHCKSSSALEVPLNPVPTDFMHPGMLHSRADLKRIRDGVYQETQPILVGFEVLRIHPLSQAAYSSGGPSAEIGRNPNVRFQDFDRDANAAYQCALMNNITGDMKYAAISIGILNSWSATLQRITGADAVLCASLGGFKIVNAAELIRHADVGWSVVEAQKFGDMLRRVFLPVIENFAPFANGNWDTAAMKMMMAIAIYTDDRALFERALLYYRFGCGDGRLAHYIYANGQCQESGRDQQHTQLGLAHMGDCCEMAWHQGLDLYSTLDNRLLLGFEYTARYNLGEGVLFKSDVDMTGKYRHQVISARGALRPIYEQIYNHYVRRRGLSAPWTQRAAEKLRPEGAAFGADHTGFGTLLYSRKPGPDTTEAAPAGVPSGLHATSSGDAIELDFVPLATSKHYTISRAEDPASYVILARNISGSTYRDRSLHPSALYTYGVNATTSRRHSQPALEMAGLPKGWRQQPAGPLSQSSIASFDGSIYQLQAPGTQSVTRGGSFFFVHRAMPDTTTFTARIIPLIASQFLELGIAVSPNGESVSPSALLLVSPRGQTERPAWTASLWCTNQHGDPMTTVGTHVLTAPAITYGRLVKPLWLQIARIGFVLRAAISEDGNTWSEIATGDASDEDLRVGLFLNSGIPDVTTTVYFDNVTLSKAH